jgi:hypothetical protein
MSATRAVLGMIVSVVVIVVVMSVVVIVMIVVFASVLAGSRLCRGRGGGSLVPAAGQRQGVEADKR